MTAIAVPDKWTSVVDEKKFERVTRFALYYRIGSGAWGELSKSAVSRDGAGQIVCPVLDPGPLSLADFLACAYKLGADHFLHDHTGDGGPPPKLADLRIVLFHDDKVVAQASKKLNRRELLLLMEGIVDVASTDRRGPAQPDTVLSAVVQSLGGQLVNITSVEARSRNEYESIMCAQMRAVSDGWQELNKDREKIAIDLVEAEHAKVRAEEEGKRLALQRVIDQDKGFFDSPIGEKLGTMLVVQLVPKLIGFVDGALTTASVGLEKRKLKATYELKRFKRDLDAEERDGEEAVEVEA